MSQHVEFPPMSACTADRRYWLLRKAVECVPLDKAIELARTAEAFITGGGPAVIDSCPAVMDAAPADAADQSRLELSARIAIPAPEREVPEEARPPVAKSELRDPVPDNKNGLGLSYEEREQLLSRMAKGANNGELAAEYGLTPRQIQGIRMGSAREITRRRERFNVAAAPTETSERSETSETSEPREPADTCIDEVVRYLRQQDDVVVPQEAGLFLVNARFRIQTHELVARANRMRARQGRPEFISAEPGPVSPETGGTANGHPVCG